MLAIAVDRDGVLDSPVGQVTRHVITPDSVHLMDFQLKDKRGATCKGNCCAFLKSQKGLFFLSVDTIKGKTKRHHQTKTNAFSSLKEAAKR